MKESHFILIPMKNIFAAPMTNLGFQDSATVANTAPVNVLFKLPQAKGSVIKELVL